MASSQPTPAIIDDITIITIINIATFTGIIIIFVTRNVEREPNARQSIFVLSHWNPIFYFSESPANATLRFSTTLPSIAVGHGHNLCGWNTSNLIFSKAELPSSLPARFAKIIIIITTSSIHASNSSTGYPSVSYYPLPATPVCPHPNVVHEGVPSCSAWPWFSLTRMSRFTRTWIHFGIFVGRWDFLIV